MDEIASAFRGKNMSDEKNGRRDRTDGDERLPFACDDCEAPAVYAYMSFGWHPAGWPVENGDAERGWLACRDHRRKRALSPEFVLDDVLDGRITLPGDFQRTLDHFVRWIRETYQTGEEDR
jgi:hypothetical protein